jgi:hypothetical protein
VDDPAQILRVLNADRIPKAIIAFMHRSLSSELVLDVAEQKRIRVLLKAMVADKVSKSEERVRRVSGRVCF